MLGTVLRLFRPTYALTALILFGGWQGYSFVQSVPGRLGIDDAQRQGQVDDDYQVNQSEAGDSRFAAAMRDSSGMRRGLLWVAAYTLMCFAAVPLVKKVLACESNAANAVMVIGFVLAGVLFAMALMAFEFGFFKLVLLVFAAIYASAMILWLAGELEKLRVADSLSSS